MRILPLYLLFFLVFACEWPFDTTPTDESQYFIVSISHDITRIVDSAIVEISWTEVTIEDFFHFIIERRSAVESTWIKRATISNPTISSYTDMVNDDTTFYYRVSISDINGNARSGEASTTIPLTTKLFVPADYDTIQHAFSTPITDDGDSIIVSPGEYNGSLGILGKNVVIKSTHGFTSTSIIADDYFRCVNINKGVLQGFLITGGFRYYKDGTSNVGGGVYASGSAILKNNYISENTAPGEGGGLYLTENASLYNNIVFHNVGNNVGGIFINNATGKVINNTIVGNIIVGDSLGGVAITNSSVTFLNNIISGHTGFDLLVTDDAPASVVAYCRFKDADPTDSNGNIPDDPLFLEVANEDFHLRPDSPCTNTGHPGDEYRNNNGSQNDMGAYGGPYGE